MAPMISLNRVGLSGRWQRLFLPDYRYNQIMRYSCLIKIIFNNLMVDYLDCLIWRRIDYGNCRIREVRGLSWLKSSLTVIVCSNIKLELVEAELSRWRRTHHGNQISILCKKLSLCWRLLLPASLLLNSQVYRMPHCNLQVYKMPHCGFIKCLTAICSFESNQNHPSIKKNDHAALQFLCIVHQM